MKAIRKELSAKQHEWLDHIKASRRSGQSVSEYARDHDLDPQHLYGWTTRLRRLGALSSKDRPDFRSPKKDRRPPQKRKQVEGAVRFSPVELVSSLHRRAGMRIRFRNGITLDVDGSISPDEATLAFLASLP
jgi:hypothetical protein